ncbi:MAG: Crp/Fnr family transcriptional regulator [Chitinophagaceae bacterium]
MEELFFLLNKIYPLTDELQEHLKLILKTKELSKGQFLLKAGHYCENVYFVGNGLLRIHYFNKNGKEENKWFMKQWDVVYAVRSFLDQIPSTEFIQALKPSTVYYISHKELQEIYKDHLTFNIHGRVLTEKYYKLSEERDEITRMPEANDRYNYWIEHYGELMNEIPDKQLASFLRMTPVSISRLRNQRTTKGKFR